MNQAFFQGSAGGVYFENDRVLLVRIEYGRNKGMWMIPGGLVEAGETMEEAAIREFKEETGLEPRLGRMVAVRSGAQDSNGSLLTSIYVVFEVDEVSGSLEKDGHEISDLKFWDIRDIEEASDIVELSKEIILSARKSKNGLYKGQPIQTKHNYISYNYYIPNA